MRTAVVALLLVLGLAGCGEDEKPEAAKPTAPPSSLPAEVGTVRGTLLLIAGPEGKSDPVPGKLTITGAGSSVNADIGEDGRYAIQLAPGSYRITATTPNLNNGTWTCTTEPDVTELAAGETVTADVICSAP